MVYHIIKKFATLKKVVKYCKQTGYACIDYETTKGGFEFEHNYPLMLGISFQPGSCYVLPLGHFESPFKNNWVEMLVYFGKEVLEDPNIIKIAQNLKFEQKWSMRYGIGMYGKLFDTMLAKYALDEERPHDLDSMTMRFYPQYAGHKDEIAKLERQYKGWDKIPLKYMAKYCATDCHIEFLLMVYFERKMIKANVYNLFRNILMPESTVIAESEFEGLPVDKAHTLAMKEKYEGLIKEINHRMMTYPEVIQFQRWAKRNHLRKILLKIKAEIKEIKKENKPNADRLIANRVQKISRLLAGEITSKKDTYVGLNLGSPQQLVQLLFKPPYGAKKGFKFKVNPKHFTVDNKTKQMSQTPSTGEDALKFYKRKYKNPFLDDIVDMREKSKLYSTYIIGTLEKLTPQNRVHANFKIHGTVTGRLSCVEPNLQNVPRVITNPDIKPMFIPPPGFILLELDYAQAELRILAELAKEKKMIEWFNQDYNIHLATACKMSGALDRYAEVKDIEKDDDHPENLFWKKKKKKAKTVNFGIAYGQTEKKLAQTLDDDGTTIFESEQEAKEFLEEWFETFPNVYPFFKKQHNFAKKHGYVINMFGRKRRLPDIYSPKFGKMLEAQRQSVNAPIQGASNDFTVCSSITINELRKRGKLPLELPQLYTVHDSIGYAVRPKYIHELVPKLLEICDNPETEKYFGFKLKYVKMKVSFEVGKSWGELHDYDEWADYDELLTN